MTLAEYRQMGKETIERLYKEQGINVEVAFNPRNATIFTPGRKERFSIYHGNDINDKYVFEVQTFSIGTVNPLQMSDETLLMQAFGLFFTNKAFAEAMYKAILKLDVEFL